MRALILTGRLVQDQEFIYPFYRLQEAGWEVAVATEDGHKTVGYFGTKIIPTTTISKVMGPVDDVLVVPLDEYDLLVLPGGVKCMEHMRMNNLIISAIERFHEKGKVIASICSAAQLLISAKIVAGNDVSGYYAMKDDIINAGANYVDAPAVTDDRIVTSPHYKHLGAWMKEALMEVVRWRQ